MDNLLLSHGSIAAGQRPEGTHYRLHSAKLANFRTRVLLLQLLSSLTPLERSC